VRGSEKIQITMPLVFEQIIHCNVHVLHTHNMSSRSAQRIGRLMNIN
jgi:hypothetical protein